MLSAHQTWDKLTKCIVGSTYPPEFYNFIEDSKVRTVFEQIANDTNEDLNNLQKKLESFNVSVFRPILKENLDEYKVGNKFLPPPLTPRDDIGVIGDKVFMPRPDDLNHWRLLSNENWNTVAPRTEQDWNNLPQFIKDDFAKYMNITCVEDLYYRDYSSFKNIETLAKDLGNKIIYDEKIDTAMICRVGKDLYSGLWPGQNKAELFRKLESLFPDSRIHIIDTQGHLDGVFSVLTEGLIIANNDLEDEVFHINFPDWEIVRISNDNSNLFRNFSALKYQNQGKWLVAGQENNLDFVNFVETYIQNWLGFVEETCVGVNVLMVDQNNMLCIKEDNTLFKKLEKYNITAHVVPFRHYNFWDSGIHCLTVDLDRIGIAGDYFPSNN